KARVARGAAYGVVQIQLELGAFTCKAPQAPQGHLEVACAQLLLVVVVAEFAFFPDFDRRAVAGRRPAHAYAFGVVAAMAEGRGAARAYPFVAAGMALLLLFEPFLEE